MRVKTACAALLPLFLASCGDPASEAEISMTPGYYEVELPGAAIAGFDLGGSDGPAKKLCLRPGDGAFFAHRVVRETLANELCDDPVNERTGNALSTRIRCTMPEGEGLSGDAYLRGSGRIKAESFSADFKLDMSEVTVEDREAQEAVGMLQAMQTVGSVSIDARRIGDCPG